MTWASFLPSPAHTPEPEARTECPPTATSSRCPTSATNAPPACIKREVSDGVIAPGYTDEALAILKEQAQRRLQRHRNRPELCSGCQLEHKDVFGVTFEQGRNEPEDQHRAVQQHRFQKSRTLPQRRKERPADRSDCSQIHPVQLGLLCQGRTGHRHRRRPAVPYPLHPTGRQQGGYLVPAPA